MDIQTKDGILLRGIPDGTPDDAIKARIAKIRAERAAPQEPKSLVDQIPGGVGEYKPPVPEREPDIAEKIAANPAVRFATVAASPFLAAGEMLPGGAGEYFRDKVSTLRDMEKAGQQDQSFLEKHIGTGANIAGTILSPAALKVMKVMPYAVGASGMARIPQLLKNIFAGSTAAGTLGALTPTGEVADFGDAKQKQITEAALIGGAFPVGTEAVRAVGSLGANIAGPFRESWRTNAARQWLGDKLGGVKKDVIDAIMQRKSIARGSPVSTADAIVAANMGKTNKFGSPLVAIEDALDALPGGPSDIAKSIRAGQEGARASEIGRIGVEFPAKQRTESMIASAIAKRKAEAEKLYGEAFLQATKVNPELARIGSNPYFKNAWSATDDLAAANKTSNIAQRLHYVKEKLDAMLNAKTPTGELAIVNEERRAVSKLNENLVDWIGKNNKKYDVARIAYKKASDPINRMNIGEELQSSITSGVGVERPASLAQTARRMEDELSTKLPQHERAAVDRVITELSRNVERKSLGQKVNVNGILDIAERSKDSIKLPQLWSRPTSIARWLMHMTGNDADMKIARDMYAKMKTNPDAFVSQYLADVPPSQIPVVLQTLEKAAISGMAQQTAQE